MNQITQQIIKEAIKHIGVREVANNDSPEIRDWLRRCGILTPSAWCMSFAWCMVDDACKALGISNKIAPCAGVLKFFARCSKAKADAPAPGYIFGIDHGGGKGHAGIVVEVHGDKLSTIEGNTDAKGSREGQGVYLRTRRVDEINLGYVDPTVILAEP